MPDHNHDGHVCSRVRHIWGTVLDAGPGMDGIPVSLGHLYLPEGALDCGCSDPGMLVLKIGESTVFLDEGVAGTLENRLHRGRDMILEAGEEPADIERDMARFAATANDGERS